MKSSRSHLWLARTRLIWIKLIKSVTNIETKKQKTTWWSLSITTAYPSNVHSLQIFGESKYKQKIGGTGNQFDCIILDLKKQHMETPSITMLTYTLEMYVYIYTLTSCWNIEAQMYVLDMDIRKAWIDKKVLVVLFVNTSPINIKEMIYEEVPLSCCLERLLYVYSLFRSK